MTFDVTFVIFSLCFSLFAFVYHIYVYCYKIPQIDREQELAHRKFALEKSESAHKKSSHQSNYGYDNRNDGKPK